MAIFIVSVCSKDVSIFSTAMYFVYIVGHKRLTHLVFLNLTVWGDSTACCNLFYTYTLFVICLKWFAVTRWRQLFSIQFDDSCQLGDPIQSDDPTASVDPSSYVAIAALERHCRTLLESSLTIRKLS